MPRVQDVGVASTTTGDENHLCGASLHKSHKKAQRHGASTPNYMYNSTCISVSQLHGLSKFNNSIVLRSYFESENIVVQ